MAKSKLPPDVLAVGVSDAKDDRARGAPARPSSLGLAFRALLGGALAMGLSVGAAWGARRYVRSSPRFAVTDVAVRGIKHLTPDVVAAEAGLAKGQNIFVVDLEQARARLLIDPWIRDAVLSRRLPGAVAVDVTEREAGAIVALGPTYLATRDGEIFKRLEPGDPDDLTVVTGMSPDAVAQDRTGVERTLLRALDLASDYERGPLHARAPLEEVHVEADGAFSLVVGRDGLSLRLGAPPFTRKLEEASRVVAELDRRGAKADVILLDNAARPDRVVVRMR